MCNAAASAAPAPALDAAFVAAFRAGTLTPELVEAALPADRVAILFLFLQLSAAVAAHAPAAGPHAPSGSVPPYAKPDPPRRKRKKKRGPKPGHAGVARPAPDRIDRRVDHAAPCCPGCSGPLQRTGRTRVRIVEDVPADLKAEVTEHTVHRDWCPRCKKQVEPVVPDAMPACTLGHRTAALSAWLHYGLGTTTSQIVDVFNVHLRQKLSPGGLTEIWHRLADALEPWYRQIHDQCLNAPVLHGDETGWRTGGALSWLWCFASASATFYFVHPKRGHEALNAFFTGAFDGVLVTDFWKAYDIVDARRQTCWPHLLRDLKAVDDDPGKPGGNAGDWPEFSKKLWRIYGDAIRLKAEWDTLADDPYEFRKDRLQRRVVDLAAHPWENPNARRLAKRLRDYGDHALRFLDEKEVPPSNNKAEREIRPAVLMRKASYGSSTDRGAHTRSVLMSVYRTLKQRGLDPLATAETALKTLLLTGQLPPLPDPIDAAG